MFRLDPKQAVLEHVQSGAARRGTSELSPLAAEIAARPVDRTYSPAVVASVAQGTEAAILAVGGFALYGLNDGDTLLSVLTTLGVVAVANVFMMYARIHRVAAYRKLADQTWKALASWTGAFVLLGAMVCGIFYTYLKKSK